MTTERSMTVDVHRNIWVDRPARQVFDIATDPEALARYVAGISCVRTREDGLPTWRMRSAAFPRTLDVQVTRWEPGRVVELESTGGELSARVTFVALNARTTAVTVHATCRVQGVLRRVLAAIGVPDAYAQRTLVRLKHHVERQPVAPGPVTPGGRDRPTKVGVETSSPHVGIPHMLGYQEPTRDAGSPGGRGTADAARWAPPRMTRPSEAG